MSDPSPIAGPSPSVSKLILEMAGQKPPPDFWEELKKRAKKWAKKWATRLGGLGVLAGSNFTSYQYGRGADLTWLVNLITVAAVAIAVVYLMGKVK